MRISRSTRRAFIAQSGLTVAIPAFAAQTVDLDLSGGLGQRPLTRAFPQKSEMILQRTRPPLLETPYEVFDKGVFTPNDQFFVRWHWASIPETIDVKTFRLAVRGHTNKPLSLSAAQVMALPSVEIAAVNQCSGNSRGLFSPRVPGAQWAHGAMGNAKWTGVRLKDLLERAGVKPGAVAVRFSGLDEALTPGAPKLRKSLLIDHAHSEEVIVAYMMNGTPLPLLNGFPMRLVVPGWYSTYWIKMLSDIEVLDRPDNDFWMTQAYTIPNTPHADIHPGQTGVQTVPINRMVPRAFITTPASAGTNAGGKQTEIRGIAMGGRLRR
jgi:DMSO/TMAO reductase YedYZ molybdopterin-dependent catalytic subunit